MIPATPTRTPHPSAKIAAAVVGVAVLLSLMVVAFALPAVKSSMHDVPLGVVGTPQQAQQLEKAATGFAVTPFIDETDARQAILHRRVYGAVVFGDTQITTLTATAASPPVAALIPVLGQKVAAVTGLPAHTEDLRSFPAADPKGVGLAAGAMPLALGGWIGAMVIMLLVPSLKGRLIATAGVAVVAGLALVATLQFAIGTFDGNFWLTWLAGILGIAATCCAVLGLREFLGGPGLGVAAVLLIFLGNPLSGLASAPEMLPRPWGAIGQLLPPGATGVLLRDVVFFDGHGATHSLVVLTAWLLGGLALYFAAVRRNTTTAQVDIDEVHIGHHRRDVPPVGDTAIGDPMRQTTSSRRPGMGSAAEPTPIPSIRQRAPEVCRKKLARTLFRWRTTSTERPPSADAHVVIHR